MQHAFIAPTNYLHLIPKESTLHLLLIHLLSDPNYVAFYKERQQMGDEIIIDNGAFEFHKPASMETIVKAIEKSGIVPTAVVAPDYPFNPSYKTIDGTYEFAESFEKYFDKDKTSIFAVPQSKKGDIQDWLQCYESLGEIKHVKWMGLSCLGIPNAFEEFVGTEDIMMTRLYAITLLHKMGLWNQNVKHHALGLGSPREVQLLKNLGVYSNDSSSVFWQAILGGKYDNTAGGLVKNHQAVEFGFPFDEKHVELIQHNIDTMESWLL